jgi:hypothetical protein
MAEICIGLSSARSTRSAEGEQPDLTWARLKRRADRTAQGGFLVMLLAAIK